MPKFIFKLETLLRHRSHVERELQRDLATMQAEMNRLTQDLAAIQSRVDVAVGDLRDNRLTGRIDLHFLAAHRRYILATQRNAHAIAEEMAQFQRRADEARAALAEAAKQRKILEKLREKHKERWSVDQARREFAELDDIGTRLAFAGEVGPTSDDASGTSTQEHQS